MVMEREFRKPSVAVFGLGFSNRKREEGKVNIVDLVAEWMDLKS